VPLDVDIREPGLLTGLRPDGTDGRHDTRVFVGKSRNRDAVLSLDDARGRERLRLIVTADGNARIEFLNEQGKPTRTLP
jgi:hypothetical protein